MARARNIKPGFFSNDELVELPFESRLLFIGLWTIADRNGRLLDRPKKIKMDIFPGDSVDCDACLTSLADSGFIRRYESNGIKAIQVVNWDKHQNPHVKESASTIPAPEERRAECDQAPDKHQANTRQAEEIPERAGLIPDSLNPITDTGYRIPDITPQKKASASPVDDLIEEFETVWHAYPKRPGASKADSMKAWRSRIKAGASADAILAGVRRYAAYVVASRTEPQFIKQPQTFFGPGKHYESDWAVIPQSRASPMGYESAKDRSRREASEQLTGRKQNEQPSFIDIN